MRLVGRDRERTKARTFVTALPGDRRALVLSGRVGLGKTALWRAVLEDARSEGVRVVHAAPVEPEALLSFVALGDLLRDLAGEWRQNMAAPQRHALDVALLLEEPGDDQPDAQAVGLATLAALRGLAGAGPLLVALDDDQWTDGPSARALAFAARRLDGAAVGFLVARRSGERAGLAPALAGAVGPDACDELRLGPLSMGALQALITDHLDIVLPRPVLRRVHEVSGGAPLHALELARALEGARPRLEPGAPLPVPERLEDLVAERIGALPEATRAALEVAALAASPSLDLLAAAGIADPAAMLAPAVAAELLAGAGEPPRFAHPLYASAIERAMQPARRRDVHRILAVLVNGVEDRARHLALAADGPDAAAAATADEAATEAAGRGASDLAADLIETAIRLTPADDRGDLVRRWIAASAAWHKAADFTRARGAAQTALRLIGPGPERAEALLRFATASVIDAVDACQQALAEAGDDHELRARINLCVADRRLLADLPAARDDARAAVADAAAANDDALRAQALSLLGFVEAALGDPAADGHLVESEQLERRLGGLPVEFAPAMNVAIAAMWRDDLDAARTGFRRLLHQAEQSGDETGRGFVLLHVAQNEWRAGRLIEAETYLEELLAVLAAAGEEQVLGIVLWLRSVIAGHRGRLDEAREAALEALERNLDDRLFGARQRAALAFVELQAGAAGAAVEQFARSAALLDQVGVREPGIVLAAGDEIEALVAVGDLEQARARVTTVEALARELDRPRLRSIAARGRGMIAAAEGDLDTAIASLQDAADQPSPGLDRPRALLALGIAQRRGRQRGVARESLRSALALFQAAGADGFAERARTEADHIGGRAPSAGDLTPAEARIAELVATGQSNKEVAAALFVTPKTVEGTLTRIYSKLGVRSRAELAHQLSAGGDRSARA